MIPTLSTPRLTLRAFKQEDAPTVQKLAGAWEIAETTGNIPHPYEDGVAEAWIRSQPERFDRGEIANFAMTLTETSELIGAIGLVFHADQHMAELGYWVGVPYWGRGYCTEAAQELLHYGFKQRNLNRIFARHMTKNPASGRVMQKIGMKYEGTLRQSILRFGKYEDAAIYGILKDEYAD